jgi:hypothetical protein
MSVRVWGLDGFGLPPIVLGDDVTLRRHLLVKSEEVLDGLILPDQAVLVAVTHIVQ